MRISQWLLACAGLAFATPLLAQEMTVDTAGSGALIDEGMNRSEAMKNLEHLTDVIGPRLTGSPAAKAANDWTMQRFKDYGLDSHTEAWTFAGTWTRGGFSARMLAPRVHSVVAASWAWAPGTGGKPLKGPVVRINASSPESLAAYRAVVKGSWLMTGPPSFVWNNDGPPMTAADSETMRASFRRAFGRPQAGDSARRAQLMQFRVDLPYILHNLGALGLLTDAGKEQGLLNMSGSPSRVYPLPYVVLAHDEFAMFGRLIEDGATPQLEVTSDNQIGEDSVPQWNTVGEIRGTEHPGQVVIVGAHLDSWDLGTGASDNGTGSIATLEAARIISKSGLKPKRTIRFVLFTGEEEGLLGSRAYAQQHAAEADSIQAVIVLDNGVGAITGQALQGRPDLYGLWRALLAPVRSLHADTITDAIKGGTDHLSFIPLGVPGFNFNQITRGYNHTHHSQSDTYDKAIDGDLRQASTVMAVSAYELANLPGMISRSPKTPSRFDFFGPQVSDSLKPKGKAKKH
ncbi:MAG TPA: M20/M25/M40 family metallo-hydrolase [Gemmatimonadales bacterium]|nr:M20/M25/M40 family metallo-hydrolase [Gemmatimonadales bacterium]